MSNISSDILIISVDPRGLGGKPGVLTVESVIADLIRTDAIDDKDQDGLTYVDAKGLALNEAISGDQLGVANGLATLDGSGKIPVNQIPDVVAGGLDAKGSCRAKTTISLPSYVAAGNQVGKTLTASANGALTAIDGVTLVIGDRVLVDQFGSASNVDNGIYTVTATGSVTTKWVFTRATDADETGEISTGTYTFVEEGTLSALKGFVVETANPIVVDTTPFTWTVFSSGLIGTTNTEVTSLGSDAMSSLTTGVDNTGIGIRAMRDITTGSRNASLGEDTLLLNSIGNENVAIGIDCMDGTGTDVSGHTAIGFQALRVVNNTGLRAVAIGHSALTAMTTGDDNTAVGHSALISCTIGINNTAVGSEALDAIIGGSNNVGVGFKAGTALQTGSQNTAVGSRALEYCVSGVGNTAIGYRAAQDLSGSYGTAIGVDAMYNATGVDNTAIGWHAGLVLTSGTGNTCIGKQSDVSTGGADDRIAIGILAVSDEDFKCQLGRNTVSAGTAKLQFRTQLVTSEAFAGNGPGTCVIDNSGNFGFLSGTPITGIVSTDNTGVGSAVLNSLTTGVDNSAFGVNTLNSLTSANDNTAVGDNALASITSNTSGLANSGNTAIGSGVMAIANNVAGTGINTGANTGIGANALAALTTGYYNTAIGFNALDSMSTGGANIGIGRAAGNGLTTGFNNIAIGDAALSFASTTSENVAIGTNSLLLFTGSNTVAVGTFALSALTSGINNTAVGHRVMNNNDTGNRNTGLGYRALATMNPTAGGEGDDNTALGFQAADNLTTGSTNTLVGSYAGNVITTGSSNVCIGFNSDPSSNVATFQIAIGAGAIPNTTNHSVQLGRNFDDNTGVLRFKSQQVSREDWIGAGQTTANIDNSGNIIRGGALAPDSETISVAGGGSDSPLVNTSTSPATTFIVTTGVGTATGTLENGALDGQIKYMLATSLTAGVKYDLDVSTNTDLRDANGILVTTMRFETTGNSATIMWDNTRAHWLIVGSGVTLI